MRNALLALVLLFCLYAKAQTPIFHLKYDEPNGATTTREEISGANFSIANQFNKPERVGGITGNALRTDGFSTWIERTQNLNFTTSLSIDTWVALESYPSDEELPYEQLTPSAFISQHNGSSGFALRINTFGRWWFEAYINGQRFSVTAPHPFPLYEWAHAAAIIDASAGQMRLYLNGSLIASTATPVNGTISKANVPLFIGKSNTNKFLGIFLVNAINAAFDDTRIFNTALSPSTVASTYSSGISNATTTGEQAIAVSPIRFQNDLQRPGYHAMPPANWTNEPHGLVNHNGTYHMFYQRTPNGPYKTQMHWGHMTSTNLVNWTNTKDALRPELNLSPTTGYDMKGIWSGDVVVHNGVAHAFYTCVNHSGSYNPGIALATSSDPGFKNWTKSGPIINRQFSNDFRDPYIFKDGSTWYMIIGAAYGGFGGLDVYTSTDLQQWTHKSDFCTVPYSAMDIGSVIWEMPVLEPIGNGKHVLIVNPIGGSVAKYGPKYTRGVYWIGTFTNGRFTPDYHQPKNLDVIHGHLSPTVTRSPAGQLVAIGMVDERRNSESQLAAGWCHVFSLPRVYTLLADNKTLGQAPAPELLNLRTSAKQTFTNTNVNGTILLTTPSSGKAEILATVPTTTASKYGVNVRVSPDRQELTRIYYDVAAKKVFLDKTRSTNSTADEERVLLAGDYDEVAFGKPTTFHIYLDNSIVEVFINNKAAFSFRIYPTRADSRGVELFSEGASSNFSSVDVWSSGAVPGPGPGPVVPVTGVSLNKTSTNIIAGETETLNAIVAPASATNQSVTWTSSDTAVAKINSNGMITGLAPGTATITVRTVDRGFTATCTVTIIPTPQYRIYDFESGNLSGWTTTNAAFSAGDVSSATTFWGGNFNHQGTYHMWGFIEGGDAQVGEMRTENFTLSGDGKVKALIAGGEDLTNLYLGLFRASDNLLIGKITGTNSEAYIEKVIDGNSYVNVICYLKAVDNATGDFGHLNLDFIRIPVTVDSTPPAPVVSLNKTNTTIAVGVTETLIATVLPSNAPNKNVTWTSSNASIATVNASGVVSAVAPGSVTITARAVDGGSTAACAVTVTNSSLVYVLDFESGNLSGWSTTGSAFSAGDVCTDLNWGWGGPFGQQGAWHLWGFKAGGDAQTGEMKTVNFTLSGNGQVTALVGGGNDINGLYVALCRTSDNLIIDRKTGLNNEAYSAVTLNGAGYIGTECYLKVVDNAVGEFGHLNLDDVRIPVSAIPVHGISLNKTSHSLSIGGTETLTATILPANATNKTITWTSSNPAVATVNASGVITAVSGGNAIITARTQNNGLTATCSITVTQQYLVLDFESGNLNGWTTHSGDAFVVGDVCTDTNWGWGGPFGQQGSWHLWGFKVGGDAQRGELRSQTFTLGGDAQVTAMIGGGNDINNLYVALCRASDHLVISRQTGDNNEAYTTKTLNGTGYAGTLCYIKIVDNSIGGWGHINVDNVRIPVQTTSTANTEGVELVEIDAMSYAESALTVYPVPVKNYFIVDVGPNDIERRIKLTDLTGRTHLEKVVTVGGKHTVQVEQQLPSGLYLITVMDRMGIKTKKIVKE